MKLWKFWQESDITECGKEVYLQLIVPCVILAYAATYACNVYWRLKRGEGSRNLEDGINSALQPDEASHLLAKHRFMTVKERHFSTLFLSSCRGYQQKATSVHNISTFQKTMHVLEAVLLIIQFAKHTILLSKVKNFKKLVILSGIILTWLTWLMLLLTVLVRRALDSQSMSWLYSQKFSLWCLSFTSYTVLFLVSILLFRSVLIGHISDVQEVAYIKSQFFTDLALFLLISTETIESQKPITPNAAPQPSILGLLTFAWIEELIWKAQRCFLSEQDIWNLNDSDSSLSVIRNFRRSTKTKNGLLCKILQYFRGLALIQLCLSLATSTMSFIPILFMQKILLYISDRNSASLSSMWCYVFLMLAGRILSTICHNQAQLLGERATIHMRSILISAIYSKTLKRTITGIIPSTHDTYTQQNFKASEKPGNEKHTSVINIMSVDAFKVSENCTTVYNAMEAFFMISIAITLLYKILGWSSVVGSLALLTFLPLSFKLAGMFGMLQMEAMSLTDLRTSQISEALQAMNTIKAFSWENLVFNRIENIRDGEITMLKKKAQLMSASHFIWFINPTIVSMITFSIFIYCQGNQLTAPIAFTALSLFAILKTPLDQIANTLSAIAQSKVYLNRIEDFLNEQETNKYESLSVESGKIGFDNATLAWGKVPVAFKLRNISINFKIHQLNVVLGPTGSGKSSLLLGLLGEMELFSGKIYVPSIDPRVDLEPEADNLNNSIAYCPQTPWLLNATVRENILFGNKYEKSRYDAVILSCSLKSDLQMLKHGDQTRIGDRGITLSGGQQQRVSLARAVYSTSRHVLLDDCLSAVDPQTAINLYENCICGTLMKGRTCILASHNVALTTKRADWVVILRSGMVERQGAPASVLEGCFMPYNQRKDYHGSENLNTPQSHQEMKYHKILEQPAVFGTDSCLTPATSDGNIPEDEHQETKMEGAVDFSVYDWYAQYLGGWKKISIFTLLTVVVHAIVLLQGFWVRHWIVDANSDTNTDKLHSPDDSKRNSHSNSYYLIFYFIIGLIYAISASGKMLVAFTVGISGSRKILLALLRSLIHACLRFHEITPLGRVMNRFSKDMDVIDQQLIPYFEGLSYCLVSSLLTLLLISVVRPQYLFFTVPVSVLYAFSAHLYIRASRELKRIDSVNISPIHQSFSETLRGIDSIRAFGDERRFIKQNLRLIDQSNAPFFYLCLTNEWIAFRIDVLGALVTFSTAALILLNASSFDPGLAGILLTNALGFTEGAQWLVKLCSSVELSMNSVERVKEYIEIKGEDLDRCEGLPRQTWPMDGKIKVVDLSLRYSPELPLILKHVSFTVDARSKIGIVGRTGAGKSSLINAFYRFADFETGCICIDGVDISKIPLRILRQSITTIPQNPTLFRGTIKSNLDPYNLYSDERILESLLQVNLIEKADLPGMRRCGMPRAIRGSLSRNENIFSNLQSKVLEGGSNFSQGQKQLLCLARSLLRCEKIMLIDEATASIDYECDTKIQQTIRNNLSDITILTIAHRIRSVIDYDKILLLDHGEIKEYDQPYILLNDERSMFYQLCKDTNEWDELFRLAKLSFDARTSG